MKSGDISSTGAGTWADLLWEKTFDAVPDLISILDLNHRIIRINKTQADTLGIDRDDAVGRPCYELVHKTDEPPSFCPHLRLIRDGQPHSAEVHVNWLCCDLAVSVSPLTDDSGNLAGCVHVARDMTSWKIIQDGLARESQVNAALAELAHKLIMSGSIEELSALVLKKAQNLTTSRYGYVGHIDPESGHLVSSTLTREIWPECRVAGKDVIFDHFTGLWGWVLENRLPLMTNDSSSDPRSSGLPKGHVPVDKFLSVPGLDRRHPGGADFTGQSPA